MMDPDFIILKVVDQLFAEHGAKRPDGSDATHLSHDEIVTFIKFAVHDVEGDREPGQEYSEGSFQGLAEEVDKRKNKQVDKEEFELYFKKMIGLEGIHLRPCDERLKRQKEKALMPAEEGKQEDDGKYDNVRS